MLEKSITYTIVGFVLYLTFRYLNRQSNKMIEANVSNKFALRMNKLYKIVGYTGIIFGAFMILGPLTLVKEKWDLFMWIIMPFCFLLLTGLGIVSVLHYINHIVSFNDQILEVQTPFKKIHKIRWEDISKVKFNPLTGYIIITGKNGEKLKIHYHLVGLKTFLRSLETRTSITVKLNLPPEI